jgi:hypothetical protein
MRSFACSADETRATLIDCEHLIFSSIMASKITILEGTLSTTSAKGFDSEDAALTHVITRARALASPDQKRRLEKALFDRIVSEDGVKATSEVVEGKMAFAKALAKAYAPQLAIVTGSYGKDEDEE